MTRIDKLWAMEVFVRVAETGSFTRAARALDLANASVTTCVRNLERQLGVSLLDRDTRRVSLTEAGLLYLPEARALLESVRRAEEQVQASVGGLQGSLHIDAPISIGHAVVCPALSEFARRYPGISVAVTLSNEPRHLIERGVDVALRMDHVEDADLVAKPLYAARYVVCCTPRRAATLPVDPAALDPQACLGILSGAGRQPNPWMLSRGERLAVVRPAGPLHFNSSDALVQASSGGAGVVHVLDIFARGALDRGELVPVYNEWATVTKTFYLVTARTRVGSAKVRALTAYLMEVFDVAHRPSAHGVVAVRAGTAAP